jgi:hypothetical protein
VKIIVAHAAWIPERRESLRRLLGQLGEDVTVSASQGPEHASVWGRRAWEWAARQDEHVLLLNDDVLVHPELRRICEAMIEAVPDECLSLHTNVMGAAAEAMFGHHWCRCYWYTGPAVILPPARVKSLLAWIYRAPWAYLSRTNEDNAAIQWAWGEQRPFWCAIPAPVVHDTAVRSTLGYDDHAWRVPSVPWTAHEFAGARLTDPAWWRVESPPPCVPNPWAPAEKLEHVRRVLTTRGAQLCALCQDRQGVVSVINHPKAPRLCLQCVTIAYTAAVRAGQEART